MYAARSVRCWTAWYGRCAFDAQKSTNAAFYRISDSSFAADGVSQRLLYARTVYGRNESRAGPCVFSIAVVAVLPGGGVSVFRQYPLLCAAGTVFGMQGMGSACMPAGGAAFVAGDRGRAVCAGLRRNGSGRSFAQYSGRDGGMGDKRRELKMRGCYIAKNGI